MIHDPVRTGVGFVDLVYHHDDGKLSGKGLLEHKVRLGHGAFLRVHEEQGGIGHIEHPLDLAAEIGMTRRIDDVDPVSAVCK